MNKNKQGEVVYDKVKQHLGILCGRLKHGTSNTWYGVVK